jgi:hypothetical protein
MILGQALRSDVNRTDWVECLDSAEAAVHDQFDNVVGLDG